MRGLMLGPSLVGQGGVASVVNVYREAGLFNKSDIHYLATTLDGSFKEKFWLFLKSWVSFLVLIFQSDLQFIHIHLASRNSTYRKILFIIPLLIFGKHYILHLHGAEYQSFYDEECGPCRKLLIRKIFNRAKCIIVLSSQWKEVVSSFSSNNRIEVVHNPIKINPKNIDSAGSCFNIFFLGRLGRRKGIFDLVNAFTFVVKKFPQARLLCGGDGEVCAVQAAIEKAGLLNNYKFLGWVSGNEKDSLMQQADLFVLPSYNEGLPMGILEALSFGIPVVSTRVGGIPDAIEDGKEGFLVDPGDIDALADRIMRVADDHNLRYEMSENAYKKALAKFSVGRIIPQIEAIYDNL